MAGRGDFRPGPALLPGTLSAGRPAGDPPADPAGGLCWPAPPGYRLVATLSALRRGGGDPAFHRAGDVIWRATTTPCGPATLRFELTRAEQATAEPARRSVRVHAWGAGARWALASAPGLLGATDELAGFSPRDPGLGAAWQRYRGLRLTRTGLVLDGLVPAIIEQQVSAVEAWASWSRLLRRFGEPAPGPRPGLRVPPSPKQLLAITAWDWHGLGVAPRRVQTLRGVAACADSLETLHASTPVAAAAAMRTLAGVGEWTAAETVQRSHGAPDLVSVGDYNLPALVGQALAGAPVDEARMLQLLEPYRPHRHRVVRLLALAGPHPRRRGHRLPLRDYRGC